jgi:AcrR family transcriptional regulator
MTPRQQRRSWQRDPDAKKIRLLDTARTLFRRRGFAATRTVDIARACEVSEGTLFHYFGSKQGILAAVVTDYAEGMVAATFGEGVDRGPPDLRSIIERLFRYAREQGTLVARLDREPSARQAPAALHRDLVVEALADTLGQWRDQGHLQVQDCQRTAVLLYGLAHAGLSACFLDGDGSDEDAWIRQVVACFEGALGLTGARRCDGAGDPDS